MVRAEQATKRFPINRLIGTKCPWLVRIFLFSVDLSRRLLNYSYPDISEPNFGNGQHSEDCIWCASFQP